MIQKQAVAAVVIALAKSREKQVKEKRKKWRVSVRPSLKWKKNSEFYETLLADLWLEEERNYKTLLRMTSENSEEIFQLTKDNTPKENTKLKELIPQRL